MKSKLLYFAAFFLMAAAGYAQDKPNVLMIVFDDLNDYIEPMGGHPQAKTPNFSRLTKEATLFTNAHSNSPVCSPSRASFMTGIHPATSGCWGFKNWLQNPVLQTVKTLPEYMKDNGYKTYYSGKIFHNERQGVWTQKGIKTDYGPVAHNGKKSIAHPKNPAELAFMGSLDATYTRLSNIPQVPASNEAPGYHGWMNGAWDNATPFHYVDENNRDQMTDEKTVDWVSKKLKQLEKQKAPFFIAAGIIRPHTPLVVPDRFFDMFPLEQIQLPKRQENDLDDTSFEYHSKSRGSKAWKGIMAENGDLEYKKYLQAYLASVAFADECLGKILDALDNSEFKDNTIVVLFSDHGYQIGEKDHLWKFTHWEDSTRVPFIIRHPKYTSSTGAQVNHPISLIDVFPTIKDLCNLSGPTTLNDSAPQLDGHSLKPFLEDPMHGSWSGPSGAVTATASYKSKNPQQQNLSLKTKEFRYISYGDNTEELYDHRRDPHEWSNLATNPEYAEIKEQLKKQLMDQVPAKVHRVSAPKQVAKQDGGDAWKDTYFKKHPQADTNMDGQLSWPEYKAHKKP